MNEDGWTIQEIVNFTDVILQAFKERFRSTLTITNKEPNHAA